VAEAQVKLPEMYGKGCVVIQNAMVEVAAFAIEYH
jgi:hypothetical protein